jgi:5'-nucleotidase
MAAQIDDRLIVAISSRALFDLSESHAVYEAGGVEAYQRHQIDHEDDLLQPGVAFELARKLLRLNEASRQHVEIVLLSRNSADTGLRIFNAISASHAPCSPVAATRRAMFRRWVPICFCRLIQRMCVTRSSRAMPRRPLSRTAGR